MRNILIVFALLACIPQLTWATGKNQADKHLTEINRLVKLITEKDFEPINVAVEGETFSEALSRAAEIIHNHIGMERLSPVLREHLFDGHIIPPEQCALLRVWDHSLNEVGGEDESKVSLVVRLDTRQLKQFSLFEMWPLYDQDFLKRTST